MDNLIIINNKNIDIVASLYSLLIITTIVYINVKNNQYFHNNCVCVWKELSLSSLKLYEP